MADQQNLPGTDPLTHLLQMMSTMTLEQHQYLLGFMAARDFDLAVEAVGELMASDTYGVR